MEMFYTPEDVEDEYGVKAKILANWRANLIGPDCMKWKDKILYHSQEIDEWFEIQDLDAEPEGESEPEPKPETERKPESSKGGETKPYTEPEPDTKSEAKKQPRKDEYLTPKDIEEEYQLSTKTLANWRSQGKGPAYFKLGNKVRYRAIEVEKWVASSRVRIYGSE